MDGQWALGVTYGWHPPQRYGMGCGSIRTVTTCLVIVPQYWSVSYRQTDMDYGITKPQFSDNNQATNTVSYACMCTECKTTSQAVQCTRNFSDVNRNAEMWSWYNTDLSSSCTSVELHDNNVCKNVFSICHRHTHTVLTYSDWFMRWAYLSLAQCLESCR